MAKKANHAGKGCGCLLLLLITCVGGMLLNPPSSDKPTSTTTSTAPAAPEPPDPNDPASIPPATAAQRDKFTELIKSSGVTFIKRCGMRNHTLTIEVKNDWLYMHKTERLQIAQTCHQIWAGIHAPTQPDIARISIVDWKGNELGGSSAWSGIWVDD